jgi:hypothetical protein
VFTEPGARLVRRNERGFCVAPLDFGTVSAEERTLIWQVSCEGKPMSEKGTYARETDCVAILRDFLAWLDETCEHGNQDVCLSLPRSATCHCQPEIAW